MAETSNRLNYQPLVDPLEIRVLALKRTTSENPSITCELHHTYLPAQPAITKNRHTLRSYHALSYEWGSPNDGGDFITIDGVSVWIRQNLHDALKQLSADEDSGELFIWVDALCINQEDLEEKSRQVAMMGDIFHKAERVIAWLGPARDDSDVAMDLMAETSKVEALVQGPERQREIDAGECAEAEAMVKLCHRSYWKRMWIVQELFLARDCVVRCGAKAVPRDAFENSLGATQQGQGWIWKGLKWEEGPANHYRLSRWRRGNMKAGLRWWINTCVQGGFQAADAHDYIYALLGVAEDCRDGEMIVPSYEKAPVQVFLEVINSRAFQVLGPEKVYGDEVGYRIALSLAGRMGIDLDPNDITLSRDDIKAVFGLKSKFPNVVDAYPQTSRSHVDADIDYMVVFVFGVITVGTIAFGVFLLRSLLGRVFSPFSSGS
ncbi:heterokaryon incompatibility protein-domain-containing protein [Podospora aff. communis PSN243]|uniref:Heterokaryon incompatibility protein-domain-containing protein n=1 Tax=Podospora aff. communis PSN243 TaxID=3040156 RepID=A0AAV9GLP5_9PEZI|nr:heterokaryon incompatibility protein-domain-containing protein [Podospora aff. communis PSN243]